MSADINLITNLKLIDMKKSENEAKGGFAVDSRMADFMPFEFRMPLNTGGDGKMPPLLTLDKSNTDLDELLTNVSIQLGLPKGGSNDYGFLYDQKSNRNASTNFKSYSFVTDEGLKSLKDGFLLIITASPKNYAKKMLYKLTNIDLFSSPQIPIPIWQATLETLFSLSQDLTFATEFHKLDGIRKVAELIQIGSFDGNAAALCRLFCIFLEFMRHSGLVKWSEMTPEFVEKIADYVNGRAKFENNESLTLSLSILLAILDKGGKLESVVQKKVQFESLIRHLEKKDENILLAVLTLMNLLYNKLDSSEQCSILTLLHNKAFRSGIENVIKFELIKPDDRIKQQLILIQELCFMQLKDLALRRPNLSEIEHIAEMDEWNYNSPRCSTIEADRNSDQSYKGLNPEARTKFADIVTMTPPGSLALDVLLDYTKRYHQRLKDIQMESNLSSEIWPSIMAHIVRSLISALSIIPEKIEDQPEVPLRPWLIMFNSERPFHDLFAVALDLFFRTWREMHARGDEDKVLHVVGNQLALGISKNPTSLKDLDDILQRKFSYFHMQKIWEKERTESVELELKSSAIRDLRQHLKPSFEELIRIRKKNVLKKGFNFAKVSKGKMFSLEKKSRFWIKLDEHERFLWYCECPDSTYMNSKMDIVNKKKLPISDIKRIVTGSEYSETVVQQIGMKLSKKSPSHTLVKQGFSIELKDQSEPLTLASTDEAVVLQWIDGLNLLLGSEILNEKEVNRLLDLEVRIRLLDLSNPPPANPPEIPDLPKNFDWIPEKYRKGSQKPHNGVH